MNHLPSFPRPAARRARPDGGYLLLEITIALTVMFMAIIVLYSSLVSGQVQSTTNKEKHRALQDVRALMEQINTIPVSSLGTVFPHESPIPEFSGLHARDQEVCVKYENANPAALPLHFQVEARWTTSMGRPAHVFLRGIRAR